MIDSLSNFSFWFNWQHPSSDQILDSWCRTATCFVFSWIVNISPRLSTNNYHHPLTRHHLTARLCCWTRENQHNQLNISSCNKEWGSMGEFCDKSGRDHDSTFRCWKCSSHHSGYSVDNTSQCLFQFSRASWYSSPPRKLAT